jgi:outer membrane beta-barrel protein
MKRLLLLISTLAAAAPAWAQTPPPRQGEPVVVPEVQRREIKAPRMPSKDWEVGVFAGTYATQNFGSSMVGGARLSYHITEDVFAQLTYAQTKASDELWRQVLPGGVFPEEKAPLKYANLSAGINVLPGEIFIGRNTAKASAIYLLAGVGTTEFAEQRRQTISVGFGMKVLFSDRVALQLDVRDHIYSLDLLGKRTSTQNLEIGAGVSVHF